MLHNDKKLAGVSKAVMVAVWVSFILGTVYSVFTYSGIYRFLAQLQLKLFNQYFPEYTFLFMLIGHLGIAILAMYLLSLFGILRYENGENFKLQFNRTDSTNRSEAIQRWIERWKAAATFLVIGTFLIFFGIYDLALGMTAGEMKEITFDDIKPYAWFNKRWVRLSGYAVPEAAVGSGKIGAKRLTYFIPVIEPGKRGPVTIFLKWNTENPMEGLKKAVAPLEGLLSFHGMPGIVSAKFEEMKIPIAPGYAVLEWKKTPRDLVRNGTFVSLTGAAFALVGAIITFIKVRKNRSVQPPAHPQSTQKAA